MATNWWQAEGLQVIYDPRTECVQPNDLLVGIGDTDRHEACVVLNHKTERDESGKRYESLSAYLAAQDEAAFSHWRERLPAGMASVGRIVVEDASLDTCMALLIFACRLGAGNAPAPQSMGAIERMLASSDRSAFDAWLHYVTSWEEGHYLDGPDTRNSVACTMATLAHALLSVDAPKPPSNNSAQQALQDCLTLLDAYVSENSDPRTAKAPVGLPEYAFASSEFEFELQHYELALKTGIKTQLALPLARGGRSIIVDAIFVTDVELSGIFKILARIDTQHSWTRRGFTLIGVHRPSLAGTGNDMTVSLDPRSGLTLEALWDRLEELEELHWAGERPRNAPRRGIAKYSTDTGEPTSSAPNQPWYDERGRYTLIGAPRAVAAGVPGTRLAWSEDVLPAIWDLYSPIRPAPEFGHIREVFGRKLQVVRWPRGEAGAVQRMPVLYQWLASQSTQSDSNHPGKFFAYEELKVVSVPGGEIIVHPRGLTIIDDWTAVNIDDASILAFAEHLARVVGGYEKVLGGTELKTLVEEELASLKKPQEMGFQALSRLRARAVGLRARVIELSARESTLKPIAGEHEIRAAIEFAWGLPQTRRELWDLLARVDELLTQSQELAERKRMYWTTSILSTAGVFVVVKEIVAVIQDNLTMNQFEMALPVWRQIGIAEKDKFSYEILKLQADIASYFDRLGFFLLVGIFLLGIFLAARRYFQKGKGSKVATNGDQN